MAQSAQLNSLPLIDDLNVKDVIAETCVGISMVAGNAHITFASITADYTEGAAPPSRRVVSSRVVMPIQSMVELRDILSRVIDALTDQGLLGQRSLAEATTTRPERSN